MRRVSSAELDDAQVSGAKIRRKKKAVRKRVLGSPNPGANFEHYIDQPLPKAETLVSDEASKAITQMTLTNSEQISQSVTAMTRVAEAMEKNSLVPVAKPVAVRAKIHYGKNGRMDYIDLFPM